MSSSFRNFSASSQEGLAVAKSSTWRRKTSAVPSNVQCADKVREGSFEKIGSQAWCAHGQPRDGEILDDLEALVLQESRD